MTNTQTVLPFSDKPYRKLDRDVFPTLRRRDQYGDRGDVVIVEHGPTYDREVIGQARIVAKETVMIEELPTAFLAYDTNVSAERCGPTSRHKAHDSINSFYQNPIEPDERITLYWLLWEERTRTQS